MKQKSLLRSMLLLFALIVGMSSAWADEVTFIPSDFSAATEDATSATKGDVTISISKGTIASEIRIFKSQTITFTSDYDITKIEFTCTAEGTTKYGPGCFGAQEGYTYQSFYGTWEGTSKEITFTASSNQVRATQIVVTVNNSSDDRTPVNMTSFGVTETTIVKGNTMATTVTNDQSGWTASYNYITSNSNVATVDANGVISAINKGTAKITATLNVDPNDEEYKAGTTTSMYVDITVVNPSHTASFYVNGKKLSADVTAEEGADFNFPDNPSDLGGKKFVGWTTEEITGTQENAPETLLNTSAEMGTADINYYAVFANQTGGTGTATLTETEITGHFTNTSLAYSSDERSWEDASDGVTWAAKGFANKNDKYIQLKKNATAYYVKIAAASNISKVKLTITSSSNNNADERNDISLNPAFSGNVLLLSTATGNATTGDLGSESSDIITNNTVEINLTSDAKTLYIQTDAGSRIWGIEATISSLVNTNYCTSIVATANITSAGYATFSNTEALDFSANEDLVVYTATDNGSSVTLNEVASKIVPANTPVVLKGDEGSYNGAVVSSADDLGANDLHISNGTDAVGDDIYVLANKSHGVGFYPWTSNNSLSAGKIYLKSVSNAPFLGFDGEGTTGIQNIERTINDNQYYTLDGRRVAEPTKGLYILNGRKVIVK